MISSAAAWNRLSKLQNFAKMRETDFRPIVYIQTFANQAVNATSSPTQQNFSGGAIILGITASCYVPGAAAAAGQSARNRQLFGLNFSYTNNETLTPGGPISADALLGGGDDTIFPSRELIIAPNQALSVQVQNFTTTVLTVQIAYHCLIYRFAS